MFTHNLLPTVIGIRLRLGTTNACVPPLVVLRPNLSPHLMARDVVISNQYDSPRLLAQVPSRAQMFQSTNSIHSVDSVLFSFPSL